MKLSHLSSFIAFTALIIGSSQAFAGISKPECGKQEKLRSKTAHVIVDQGSTLDQAMFPLTSPALNDYTQGSDAFGASRANGRRQNNGVNLETSRCAEVIAVAAGRVVRAPYLFYQNTKAVDVLLQDGTNVRYGFLSEAGLDDLKEGDLILQGQTIGYVEQLPGAESTKLRIELSNGELMDPTLDLVRMERRTFFNRD